MCGICGIVDFKEQKDQNINYVKGMVSKLRHRGPDFRNIVNKTPAILGHARLSIIDPSSLANQPMFSSCSRYALVFNGEIYNFKELRQELKKLGHNFQTSSDTEVLLNAYQEFGKECVLKLEGMFAFAVWDSLKEELFLARDRFGQKPLVFYHVENRISFSSELQSLLEDSKIKREANLTAIYHYLSVQSVPAPFSSFLGINKVEPAQCVLFKKNKPLKKWKYYVPEFTSSFTGTEQEATEELEDRLLKAVKTHLVSDVPLGLFLSGGVDSSLITAMASKINGKMHSFSMGFSEEKYDERPFAKKVATIYNTEHYAEISSPDIINLLPKLVRHYGEPFADPSAIPTWLLSQMTSNHVAVALSGDGGDDLFGGYERYLNPFLYPHGCAENDSLKNLRTQLEAALGANQIDKNLYMGIIKYYFHWSRIWEPQKKTLCSNELKQSTSETTFELMLQHFSKNNSGSLLDKIQDFELRYYLSSTLMTKVDIASMGASLEIRAPFLDNNVADFALSLPQKMRVAKNSASSFNNGYEPKYLLKKVAEKYLPKEITYRKKQGFGVPIADWFKKELKEMVSDLFSSNSFKQRGWVCPDATFKLLKNHTEGKANYHFELWTLLMLELWAKEFIDAK